MISLLTPIIFFCSFVQGQTSVCDGKTALWHQELTPVYQMKVVENLPPIDVPITNPMLCITAAYMYAIDEVNKFKDEHPNKDLEFRIVCKHEKV